MRSREEILNKKRLRGEAGGGYWTIEENYSKARTRYEKLVRADRSPVLNRDNSKVHRRNYMQRSIIGNR